MHSNSFMEETFNLKLRIASQIFIRLEVGGLMSTLLSLVNRLRSNPTYMLSLHIVTEKNSQYSGSETGKRKLKFDSPVQRSTLINQI